MKTKNLLRTPAGIHELPAFLQEGELLGYEILWHDLPRYIYAIEGEQKTRYKKSKGGGIEVFVKSGEFYYRGGGIPNVKTPKEITEMTSLKPEHIAAHIGNIEQRIAGQLR
jgi:hypothetical protein